MRKDTREHLEQLELACELAKLIRRFFPGLVPLLKKLPAPRNQSYTTYPGAVLLMTRILSSIFYISSMRKTSEEFNSDTVIENVWSLCGEEPAVDELPYWETINRYLKRMDPCGLQEAINSLCRRLLRSRAFEDMRIRGKYWQVIIDGTQLYSTRGELDGKSLYRIHQKETEQGAEASEGAGIIQESATERKQGRDCKKDSDRAGARVRQSVGRG
nr:hypothetical protein [uncultured Acetatifactor sp.]